MSDSDAALARLRAPHAGSEVVHLNHAGFAPMCRAARDAGVDVLDRMMQGSAVDSALLPLYDGARASYARLVGCDGADVSFFQTAAAAISQVAFGLSLEAGDEIVRVDQEYPSNAYAWHRAAERAGGRVVVVPSGSRLTIDIERLIAAVTPRTRVLALSSVQFQTGAAVDLAPVVAACHRVGAVVCVDAIQSLGVMPFDMRRLDVDYVCGGTHKWMLGPLGHGFLCCDAERRARLTPLLHGAITYGLPADPVDVTRPARTSAQRFEPGTPLVIGAVAGAAAIDELLAVGIARVHGEALALADRVVDGARARGCDVLSVTEGAARSPIVTFVPRGNVAMLARRLADAHVSVAERAGGLRVSPHVDNGPQHVDRLFEVLDSAV
jgi:selenocysteine lyase/cysteine desulfurase